MKTKLKNFFKLFIFSVIIIFSNAISTKAMAPPPPPPLPTPVNAPTTPAKAAHPLSNLDNCPCCGMSYTPPKPGKCSTCKEKCPCKCGSCGGCIKYSTNGKCSECINCPCDCEDNKDKSNNCKKCAKNAEICNPCLNGKCFCGKCGKHKCPCRDIGHIPCAICGSRCSECLTDCECKICECAYCNIRIHDNQDICNLCHPKRHKKCNMCLKCCRCECHCCGKISNQNRCGWCEDCYEKKCPCKVCGSCILECKNCPCTCEACLGFVDDAKAPCGQCAPCSDCGKCNKHYCGGHGLADGNPPSEQPGGGGVPDSSVRVTLYDYDKNFLSSEAEENPGLFMRLNCDDDNENDIIDKNEDDEVGNEDDFVWVYFAVWTDRSSGDVKIERTNNKIKLYKPSFDDDNKVDDSKAIVILGDNDSKSYSINEFKNGSDSSSFINDDVIEGWCLMEGYEPGVAELKIRFDGEEDKGKITVCGPIIQNNGVDITDVIEVWAGEKIELSCDFVSPDVSVVDYSWDIPETRIKNYICEISKGEIIKLPNSSLDDQNIAFYWTDGLSEKKGGKLKKVKCTVTLDTGEQMTAEAVFKVKLPKLQFVYEGLHGKGIKYLEGDAYVGADTEGDYGLWKGGKIGEKVAGFESIIALDDRDVGETAWVQVIIKSKTDWCYFVPYTFRSESHVGLDKKIFHHYNFSDSPGMGLMWYHYRGTRDDCFHTYLMFKSNKPNSIWVPAWFISWAWQATAFKPSNDVWSLIRYVKSFSECTPEDLENYFPEWDNVVMPD